VVNFPKKTRPPRGKDSAMGRPSSKKRERKRKESYGVRDAPKSTVGGQNDKPSPSLPQDTKCRKLTR